MKKIIAVIMFCGLASAQNGGPESQFKLMKSTSAAVRRAAVSDIGRMRQPSSVTILCEALEKDTDFGVRAQAAEALGNMRSREAIPSLVKALGDTNRNVRSAVIVAFGYIRDSKSVKPLTEYLKEEKDLGLQISALNVLGVIGSEEAAPALIEMLESKNPRLSAIASQSLGRMRYSKAAQPLLKAAKNDNESLRMAAIKALGEIRNPDAVKPLEGMLEKEKSSEIKDAIVYSLAQLGSDKGFDIALAAAKSEDINTKRKGLRALGLMKKTTKEIEKIVLEAFQSPDRALKRDAESTASYLGIKLPAPEEEKKEIPQKPKSKK
ncbi:HEAT repeat domain-containing protein [bacterium]|nr:HEAT repeat domain-containing protein [bacterium]MBU3956435.1 HEAT repeat domain-containing protein [bacterium]